MSHDSIAQHYARLIGLERPWQVSRVEVSHEDQEVRIFVIRGSRPKLRCPECDPRSTSQNRPMVDVSKPANG